MKKINRRNFIRRSVAAGAGLSISPALFSAGHDHGSGQDVRIGIIGLDTSHSIAFTRIINNPEDEDMRGYRVVAAYPYGSRTIESSYTRIPGYTEEIKSMGIAITGSIRELLGMVDVVLLLTNDGTLHLKQAMEVFEAGKMVFIDKPVAGSLKDAIEIFRAGERYGIPVFSSSSLRWARHAQALRSGELAGRIIGADAYSPALIEPTHPDLFWYGVHGVETLYTVMGTGCREVKRFYTEGTDVVVGTWHDERLGTFRGGREGRTGYGGTAFGLDGVHDIGPYDGYRPMMLELIRFFGTGEPPVKASETIEIFAFMEAADESKRRGGAAVLLDDVMRAAAG